MGLRARNDLAWVWLEKLWILVRTDFSVLRCPVLESARHRFQSLLESLFLGSSAELCVACWRPFGQVFRQWVPCLSAKRRRQEKSLDLPLLWCSRNSPRGFCRLNCCNDGRQTCWMSCRSSAHVWSGAPKWSAEIATLNKGGQNNDVSCSGCNGLAAG